MRKLIILSILLSTTAMAEEVSCNSISKLAEAVMSARQEGVDMSDMMKVGKGNPLLTKLTIQAYEKPRYRTPSNQKITVKEFANNAFLACVKKGVK